MRDVNPNQWWNDEPSGEGTSPFQGREKVSFNTTIDSEFEKI
ncbi:hypothetical protein J5U23_02254 [Saccharolobus shibatae B12]|uniref:Uncharacterized protein n=1 Tax=Saccharolobus shibatae (strain ATCC 51178 / DSM 5389 / JCM 8931 / NBRC 15437 / B12) TaxID=523848 RepID=A0A8F5GTY7_SACSH|nr:hypothetical protein J5U23_02254 [Saccharolobus shibatae B12]